MVKATRAAASLCSSQMEWVRKRAAAQGCSISVVIQQCVKAMMEKEVADGSV